MTIPDVKLNKTEVKINASVKWTCPAGNTYRGTIVEVHDKFAVIALAGGRRRWVRIEDLRKDV